MVRASLLVKSQLVPQGPILPDIFWWEMLKVILPHTSKILHVQGLEGDTKSCLFYIIKKTEIKI